MEILLEQIFDCASITPYKNYSDLSEMFSTNTKETTDSIGRLTYLYAKNPKLKNSKFFYSDSNFDERIQLNYAYKHPVLNTNSILTNNIETISKHFIDPFSSVVLNRYSRSVTVKDGKITIKIYKQEKYRDVFSKYYRKTSSVHSITIDKNFNFITLSMEKYSKVNKKYFRKNTFRTLEELIRNNYGLFKKKSNIFPTYYDDLINDYENIFNDEVFYDVICRELGIMRNKVTCKNTFFNSFLEKFVETKNIKVPNNYEKLLIHFYPTEKYLKKNNRKLIASILDYFNLKSKSTIKLLHKIDEIDIDFFTRLCYMLGNDYSKYIGNLNSKLFELDGKLDRTTNRQKENRTKFIYKSEMTDILDFFLEDKEKENLIHILNSLSNNISNVDRFMNDFLDHINMIRKIREYDNEIVIRCKTFSDFTIEHLELSKLISAIRKGWVTEYEFNEKMVEDVQTPINVYKDGEKITLYPYILKREEEYAEEGAFMHHCVGTYAEKKSSIIISLRTEDKQDRVTSEFLTDTGKRIQSRHFCNQEPPEYFKEALNVLCYKTEKYAKDEILKSLSMKKVKVKINGIEIEPNNR